MRPPPALVLVLLLALAPPGLTRAAGPAPSERGRVVQVIDGDTVVLGDGRQVRLVGIQAPKLPLGRPGFKTWPLAEAAKTALQDLTLDRDVALAYGGRRLDRHGRALAHLYLLGADGAPGTWVQGALLDQGLARVYGFADNRALMAEMLAREAAARAARRGIWGDPFYAVRTPAGAGGHVGSFQLVEGKVLEASNVRGRVYLNFGADWRSDFTIYLAPKVRRLFEREGHDPLAYGGKRVRVRGWIQSYNGPMIEATHPEQIEVIEE